MAVIGVWAFILFILFYFFYFCLFSFCNRHRWHIKQKNKKPWKHTKQIFPEQKTKKSFALQHLCPVHEVLTGICNPLISAQIVSSFGQGKSTFDCQSGNLKNYASANHVSRRSCMLIKNWNTDHLCDVLNGFQNRMQTINNDLINSCKKTCYSIGGRHDRFATYISHSS